MEKSRTRRDEEENYQLELKENYEQDEEYEKSKD